MENKNINMEDKISLPTHIQTPDQIYQWVHKYTEAFRYNLLCNVMKARGYAQNYPDGPWEKIKSEADIAAEMEANAKAFKAGEKQREQIKKTSKKFGKM